MSNLTKAEREASAGVSAAILALLGIVAGNADPSSADSARVGMAALGVVGRDVLERAGAFAVRLLGREDETARAFAEIVERDVGEPKVQGNVKHTIRAALDAIDDAALDPLKRLCQRNVIDGRFFDRFSRQVARMLCESTTIELDTVPRALRALRTHQKEGLFVVARFEIENGLLLEQYGLIRPRQPDTRARAGAVEYESKADDLRRLLHIFAVS